MINGRQFIISNLQACVLVFGSFGLIAALTLLLGDLCWPPRIGGAMIGIAVFAQGYVAANPDAFAKEDANRISRERRVMHVVYFVTVFGTFLWAFGDLIHSLYGVPVCRAP
jgi:hypothetical protein